jgi:hypothetical protein
MTETANPQTEAKYRAAAQDQFGSEDLIVDADAKVIPAEGGAWVQSRVYGTWVQSWVRVDDSK